MNTAQYLKLQTALSYSGQQLLSYYDCYAEEFLMKITILLTDSDLTDSDRTICKEALMLSLMEG